MIREIFNPSYELYLEISSYGIVERLRSAAYATFPFIPAHPLTYVRKR